MATTHYRCEACGNLFPADKVTILPGNIHVCPNEACYSEDIFPFRLFQCTTCKFRGDQYEFFPGSAGDPDPIEQHWPYQCECEHPKTHSTCGGTEYIQVPVPKNMKRYKRRSDEDLKVLRISDDSLNLL